MLSCVCAWEGVFLAEFEVKVLFWYKLGEFMLNEVVTGLAVQTLLLHMGMNRVRGLTRNLCVCARVSGYRKTAAKSKTAQAAWLVAHHRLDPGCTCVLKLTDPFTLFS